MGLIDSLYSKVYITVLIKDKECNINVEITKGGSVKSTAHGRYFLEKDLFSETMIRYILSYKNKYSFVYVAVLLNSPNQGAISGTLKSNLQKIGVNLQTVDAKVIENNFTIYADIEELNLMQRRFEATSLDIILTPIGLLHYYCKRDMAANKTQMFILYKNDSTTITIFKASSLLFAIHLVNHNEEEFSRTLIKKKEDLKIEKKEDKKEKEEEEEEDDLMFFDNTDDDDIDLEEPEEEEHHEEPEEEEEEEEEETEEDKLQRMLEQSSLEKGQKLLVSIKDSLDDFYKSDFYKSDFVTGIIIIDGDDLSNQVNSYIEDELMLPITKISVDIKKLFMDVVKAEVKK